MDYYLLRNGEKCSISFDGFLMFNTREKILTLTQLNDKFEFEPENLYINFLEQDKDSILHYWPEIKNFIIIKFLKNYCNNDIQLSRESIDPENQLIIYPGIYCKILRKILVIWKYSNIIPPNNFSDKIFQPFSDKYLKHFSDKYLQRFPTIFRSIIIHPDFYSDANYGFIFNNKVFFKYFQYKFGNSLII